MKRVQDWLNAYIDALLGERSPSARAGEAQSDDEALLMKAARRLKYGAGKGGLGPRPEFVASLEKDLRKELRKASPKVQRIPFWRLSWARALAGTAAAAAVLMAFILLRTGPMLPVAPLSAPARAPAAAPAPVPKAAAPAAAPTPAEALRLPSRAFPELVAEAQTILLGRVVEASTPPPAPPREGPPSPYDVRLVISVERYLKGPLPEARVALRAASSPVLGGAFSPGERVLVMAGDVDRDGVLEVLLYPQARYTITPEGQAVGGVGVRGAEVGERLTLEELLSRIEGLLRGRP